MGKKGSKVKARAAAKKPLKKNEAAESLPNVRTPTEKLSSVQVATPSAATAKPLAKRPALPTFAIEEPALEKPIPPPTTEGGYTGIIVGHKRATDSGKLLWTTILITSGERPLDIIYFAPPTEIPVNSIVTFTTYTHKAKLAAQNVVPIGVREDLNVLNLRRLNSMPYSEFITKAGNNVADYAKKIGVVGIVQDSNLILYALPRD